MTMTRRAVLQIALAVGLGFPLSGCSYNKFVSQEENVKAQWAQVQNQLQRRNDLIPNLVETTKGFAQHEESVFKDIADARSQLLSAKSPDETIAAANRQTSALGRLLAVVENYPKLKANEQFNRLMDGERYVLTDFRLLRITRAGDDEVALDDISDIQRSEIAADRLLGTSTIVVHRENGAGPLGPIVLTAVRRGAQLAALLELLA